LAPSDLLDCPDLVQRFGCSVSHVLSDPSCLRFWASDVVGVIPYRQGIRCAVGIGDPVCPPGAAGRLAERFRESLARRRLSTVFAVASERFARFCIDVGFSGIEFAEELILDPRRDPSAGSRGRELRKNLYRAQRSGLVVEELRERDPALEWAIERAAHSWLAGRRGAQAFISPILLFTERRGRRWFYARSGRRVIGVLSLVRLDARDGWVFEHLLPARDAPTGTSETLVTHALETLGLEGCRYATFGPSPLGRLGKMHRVGWVGHSISRAFFDAAARLLHFDAVSHFRKKFSPSHSEPRFLLFHPPRLGVCEATSLLRAFNVSLKW
jgi:lysylphosphatidylglycerol synthetase-like protein (DUF2156 family)